MCLFIPSFCKIILNGTQIVMASVVLASNVRSEGLLVTQAFFSKSTD